VSYIQVWKVTKTFLENILWRIVDLYYAQIPLVLVDASKMPLEERNKWKILVFSLEDQSTGSSEVVGVVSCESVEPADQSTKFNPIISALPINRQVDYISQLPNSSPAAQTTSVPFPEWMLWSLILLILALTFMNSVMFAILWQNEHTKNVALTTYPLAHPDYYSTDIHRHQVEYWRRVSKLASSILDAEDI
jgi:hypothetical protein